ncbi:MAG: efflux RND transporter periplasmic adaptor subunit [Planctomycetes bacterium]|nr:efflux RND transporter periplasmic adaptor subunit [Planctomycetota bacterium]
MLHSRIRIVFAVVLCTLSSSGCGGSLPPAVTEEHQHAQVKVVAPQVLALEERTELVGGAVPLPNQAGRITSLVEGRIVSILEDGKGKRLHEGQWVDHGQVVVQLDDRIAKANVEKAQALAEELDELKTQTDLTEQLALLELGRLEKLRPPDTSDGQLPLVSRIELDKARLALQDARSKQKGALAKQRAARAEAQGLQTQLEYFKLRAPISGILGSIQVVPGQTLAVGAPVADIINLQDIDILCVAPPHMLPRLALQQPASLRRAGTVGNNPAPQGNLVFLAEQAQADTGNFFVKVRFPNRELRLRANTVVRVEVVTQPEKKRLTIPEAALQEDQDPPIVIVAADVKSEKDSAGKEEKTAKARKLQAILGVRDRNRHVVELLRLIDPESHEAVDPHDLLFVIEGGHGLRNGDELKLES